MYLRYGIQTCNTCFCAGSLLSPLAEDLFHKAIAMSGVAPLEAHYTSNPLAMAQVLQHILIIIMIIDFSLILFLFHQSLLQMIANLSDCESSNSKEACRVYQRLRRKLQSAMKKVQ